MAGRNSEPDLPIVVHGLPKSSKAGFGMIIHRCTSVYIELNEVELRLGTNVQVHEANILLTTS